MEERRESATSLADTEFRRGATASPSVWAIWIKNQESRIKDQESRINYLDQGLRIRMEEQGQGFNTEF